MVKQIQIAFQYFKNKNYAQAWEACQNILKIDPLQPDCLAMLGMMCNKAERYYDAVKYLQKCLIHHPHKHVILTELATSLVYLENYSVAEEYLTKSMAINTEYPKTYIQFGKLYKQTERRTEAKNILLKLLAKKPESASALNNLGTLLIEDENEDEALACFEKVIKINPNTGIAHKNIGLIALKKRQTTKAEMHFLQALKTLPTDIDLLIELGQLWFSQTRLTELKGLTGEGLKIAPENIELLLLSANANMQIKKFDDAIVNLEKILQIQPENSTAFYKLARCKTDLYDWENWEDTRNKFIKKLSNDVKKEETINCSTYDTHYYNIPDNLQHKLMLNIANTNAKSIPPIKFEFDNRSHTKIRIGYISPDFRQHALGMSVYEYFQHHNREQFEIYAFAVFMPKNTDP